MIETADAEPAVAVRFEEEAVFAGGFGGAVVLREDVDEAFGVFRSDSEGYFARNGGEIVDDDDGVVAPVVAES